MVRNVAMAGGPGRRTRWVVGGSLTTLALLPACASTHPSATPQATVPVTSATADPYAVPAKITPAYVQRVLDALEGVNGEATARIVALHRMDDQSAFLLRAVFGDQEFQTQTQSWASQVAVGLKNYKSSPRPIRDQVQALISGTPRCVFVSVRRDFGGVAINPPPSHVSYIELVPLIPSDDPRHVNPTPWAIGLAGVNSAGVQPQDPCASAG